MVQSLEEVKDQVCKKEQEKDKLLENIKVYLNITWNEEDESIKDLILEAKQYLSEKTGTVINFEEDLVALGLLKDYCRYTRNYSKEYFEQNFLEQILHLQLKYATQKNEGDSNEGKTEA